MSTSKRPQPDQDPAKQTSSGNRPLPDRGSNIRLAPLTHDQALAAALRVKPADLKRLEAEERAGKQAKGMGRKK
jgi:hypothetical protein